MTKQEIIRVGIETIVEESVVYSIDPDVTSKKIVAWLQGKGAVMEEYNYPRIPDEAYNKLKFQAQGQFIAVQNQFKCYGLQQNADLSIPVLVEIAEKFCMAVRGWEKPIHVLHKPIPRALDGGIE